MAPQRMTQHSSLLFLKEWFKTLKADDHRSPVSAEVAALHEALSIRSREIERLQTTVEEASELLSTFPHPNSVNSASSTVEFLDVSTFRQFLITQAQCAAPCVRVLRAFMETDPSSMGGECWSAVELIQKKVHDSEAKTFAIQIADELHALDIKVIGGNWWTHGTFQDGCTAFWLAFPRESQPDKLTTYALIDLSESSGSISSRVNDPVNTMELIGFLLSLYERRHFHRL